MPMFIRLTIKWSPCSIMTPSKIIELKPKANSFKISSINFKYNQIISMINNCCMLNPNWHNKIHPLLKTFRIKNLHSWKPLQTSSRRFNNLCLESDSTLKKDFLALTNSTSTSNKRVKQKYTPKIYCGPLKLIFKTVGAVQCPRLQNPSKNKIEYPITKKNIYSLDINAISVENNPSKIPNFTVKNAKISMFA